jgi:hypothetical protein
LKDSWPPRFEKSKQMFQTKDQCSKDGGHVIKCQMQMEAPKLHLVQNLVDESR